ncbi:MAG: hypothetical protein WDW38_010032 [Sanguina aurantia]
MRKLLQHPVSNDPPPSMRDLRGHSQQLSSCCEGMAKLIHALSQGPGLAEASGSDPSKPSASSSSCIGSCNNPSKPSASSNSIGSGSMRHDRSGVMRADGQTRNGQGVGVKGKGGACTSSGTGSPTHPCSSSSSSRSSSSRSGVLRLRALLVMALARCLAVWRGVSARARLVHASQPLAWQEIAATEARLATFLSRLLQNPSTTSPTHPQAPPTIPSQLLRTPSTTSSPTNPQAEAPPSIHFDAGSDVGLDHHNLWGGFAAAHFHGRLLPGCCHLGCVNLGGVSEGALPTLLCGSCRRVRYCSVACQRGSYIVAGGVGVL